MKTFSLMVVMLVVLVAPALAEAPSDWEHSVMTGIERAHTLVVSPDGQLLAVACSLAKREDQWKLLLVSLPDRQVVHEMTELPGHPTHTLWFSRDSQVLYVPNMLGDEHVVAWDIKNKEPMATVNRIPYSGYSETVAVNPEPSSAAPFLAVESQGSFPGGVIRFYDQAGQALGDPIPLGFRSRYPSTSLIDWTAFSPTGDYCVVTGGDGGARLVIWSYAEGKWNFHLEPPKQPFKLPSLAWDVVVSPYGETVAVSASESVTLLTIDLKKKKIGKQSLLKGEHILQVAFLPDGRLVAAGAELAIHDLKTGDKVWLGRFNNPATSVVKDRYRGIAHLAVHPDGSAIYGIIDRQIHVWRRKEAGTGVNTGSVQNP